MKLIKQISEVDLGKIKLNIPVYKSFNATTKSDILITAGMDGDELASIDAAYELISKFQIPNSKIVYSGNITIIPIVNISGFQAGTGCNPLDNLCPKWFYPGKAKGKPSERLIHWLVSNYLPNNCIWIDLHGGGKHEYLEDIILSYETKNPKVNKTTRQIIGNIKAGKIFYEYQGAWSKTENLAKRGITYLIFESGHHGLREKRYIDRHVNWVTEVFKVLKQSQMSTKNIQVYSGLKEILSPFTGLWSRTISDMSISKSATIGIINNLDLTKKVSVKAKEDGEMLWISDKPYINKGEFLYAYAKNIRKI